MASIFKRKGEKRWTIAWFDHEGNRQEKSSGTTDKRLAERIAGEWENREIERIQGLVDPAAERLAAERARALVEHFNAYETHMVSLQRDRRHIDDTIRYLTKAADALNWNTLADVDAHVLTSHLSEQARLRGTGARTFNAAATAWRAFGRWCVRANRLALNPLASIGARNLEGDRRRVRRDISTEELARIIAAAVATPVVKVPKLVKDASGRHSIVTTINHPERMWAYRIAAGTGFRAGEISSLTPESFELDGENPHIVVEAGYSKRRRRDIQPIRADLAAILRPWIASKAPGERLNLLPPGRAGAVLKADMAAARVAWLAEAPTAEERAAREASDFLRHTDTAGRVADFHGLRVHFVSRVVEAGANVKEAMELARHSDPKLTMKTYAKVGLHNLTRVLDGLPPADARPARKGENLRATGTDPQAVHGEKQGPQKSPHFERGIGRFEATQCENNTRTGTGPAGHKDLENRVLHAETRQKSKTGDLGFEPSRPITRRPIFVGFSSDSRKSRAESVPGSRQKSQLALSPRKFYLGNFETSAFGANPRTTSQARPETPSRSSSNRKKSSTSGCPTTCTHRKRGN